jgi:CheY-like chemotaxis protein
MLAYAGQGRHEAKRVDVAALIEETVTLLKATIPKTVALDLELQHASVEADPAQLQQVVMNMVINAAEAIPEGRPGHVLVSSSTRRLDAADQARSIVPIELGDADYVEIRFTDTGTGIPAELQRRIFDPFFTTKFAGRGLGLSAVLGIVRSHGGTLTLESQPGKGTTFRVLLPAVAAGIAPAASERPAALVAAGTTILVVDDEETVRSAARRALERYGYSVCVAGNGREAIAAVGQNPAISAVVLDLAMPELTGDQVAPLLRAHRPGLPIIGSSGYSESEAIRRFGGVHIRAFLQKPYTAHALVEKVTAVVGNGGSQR